MPTGGLQGKKQIESEKESAAVIAGKLRTPLDSRGNPEAAAQFLRGGYQQEGYGVPAGAAIDGSHAAGDEGNQGYYVTGGKECFLKTVDAMSAFFKRRSARIGKPVRYVIKPGIGGQHTPFQGISELFASVFGQERGIISGEYELGKDFEDSIGKVLGANGWDWDQVAVIPSSKSGSTDETMMIFTEIFYLLLKQIGNREGLDGKQFADVAMETLNRVNFIQGKERSGKDLFKVEKDRFGTDSLIFLITKEMGERGLEGDSARVRAILGRVLGNMFFETTDRAEQSRLSAFIRNSGLDRELGDDSPGFGAMFDNVGGRWTGDLHMMTFLAFYELDALSYWEARRKGIESVRLGTHLGNRLGHAVLDGGITDIALLVPDEFFWFGKSIEQNFNESIWQEGFANLIAVVESQWNQQSRHYEKRAGTSGRNLVIHLTAGEIPEDRFYSVKVPTGDFRKQSKQGLAHLFGELLTTFYGMTNTVGTRLIARALKVSGFSAEQAELNEVMSPATGIVQKNLFLRQPYVELGKGLLEKKLKSLQAAGTVSEEFSRIQLAARKRVFETNLPGFPLPNGAMSDDQVLRAVREAFRLATQSSRKFVPFFYLEGGKFLELRKELVSSGIEWVMQGTGDQHISYQQVLAQPGKFFAAIVSFVPGKSAAGHPAVGFAKGYLHQVSPHMVRDLFAEASYKALTELRQNEGGLGLFLRTIDSPSEHRLLAEAFCSIAIA
ncbi:MAG TPA: hypothetical protein PKL97_09785 [Candidatus Omnitrophota bacterium]|nr:hypothetical protein [Candidatus Omnitrophota bacterium]